MTRTTPLAHVASRLSPKPDLGDYEKRLEKLGAQIDPQPNGCWLWTGGKSYGYGKARDGLAHRVVYEILKGPIPEGFVLHHECGDTACVRPKHLTPMSNGDHVAHHAALRRRR